MSGKYRNGVQYMFVNAQPILVRDTDTIKGVVVARRDYCDNKKVSIKQAKDELLFNKRALNRYWGVPIDVKYKEPVKDFVWQDPLWDFEEFCLSTLLEDKNNKRVLKQRVWFFELEEYVELEW
ncbi:MAG: hypothetical protein ACRCXT_23220 [Paraclostridium sp.]